MEFLNDSGLQYFADKLKEKIIPATDKGQPGGVPALDATGGMSLSGKLTASDAKFTGSLGNNPFVYQSGYTGNLAIDVVAGICYLRGTVNGIYTANTDHYVAYLTSLYPLSSIALACGWGDMTGVFTYYAGLWRLTFRTGPGWNLPQLVTTSMSGTWIKGDA